MMTQAERNLLDEKTLADQVISDLEAVLKRGVDELRENNKLTPDNYNELVRLTESKLLDLIDNCTNLVRV